MSAFTKSWSLLKEGSAGMDGLDNDGNYPEDPRQQNYRTPTVPINMQQGSDGTWRAPGDITPEEKLWQQIQARNAQARQNLQKPAQVAQPKTTPQPKPTPQPGYSGWM